MTARGGPGPGPREEVVERLVGSWPRRAGVRSTAFEERLGTLGAYDAELPDYPVDLLPFASHPAWEAADPATRSEVLTWAWLVYNDRVVAAEEHVAVPAFRLVAQGAFPGCSDVARQAVQQTVVDEAFHTYMHQVASARTLQLRGWPSDSNVGLPLSVTYRRFLAETAARPPGWERELVLLAWTLVSEVSINAYLALLSRDRTIQPAHRLVTSLHDRDEAAHSKLMVEVAKGLYLHMGRRQRAELEKLLATARDAFAAQDFSGWEAVVGRTSLRGGSEMVDECRHEAAGPLVRDFSGVDRLVEELGLRVSPPVAVEP